MTTRGLQEATLLVLTALSRGSQHGYGIIADVQQISGGRVTLRAGTLYTALDRLRAAGLIGVDRDEVADGRPRRYYRLTAQPALSAARPHMTPGPDLRAGDADREAAAAALGEHFAQGRLTLDELLTRLDAAFTAAAEEHRRTSRDLAGPSTRRGAGSRCLRRRLVLVAGHRAAAARRAGRRRRAEPADLPGRRRGAHPAHPGAARRAGDPGRSFLRGHRDHRGRDPPARCGPGLHRGSRPDVGEDYAALAGRFPAPPANAGLVYTGGFGGLTEDAFLNDFANGVDPDRARVLYAVQGRVSESLFREKTTAAAWRSKPSWYAISRQDRTTSPDLQRFLAKRMNATTVEIDSGHLSLITHPQEVTQLILSAARTASQYAAADGS